MTPTCRVCGRLLRSPESQALRVGPACGRRTHSRTARLPPPADGIHPGQAELPLPPIQTALELTKRT